MNTPFSLSGKPMRFAPISFADDTGKPKAEFRLGQWTDHELDQLNEILFQRGIVQPTTEDQRALMVNELFQFYDEPEAERRANVLDEFWQDSDRLREQMDAWELRDLERRRDTAAGAPDTEAETPPRSFLSIRVRSEAQTVATDLRDKSEKLRVMMHSSTTYARRSMEAVMRLTIQGWTGLETKFETADGMVTERAFAEMRRELGTVPFSELRARINSNTIVGSDEVGNLDSPVSGNSGQSSSPAPNGASGSSAGSSTTSSIEPAQAGGSGETTTGSSSSTGDADGESRNTANSPAPAD
jgi:hypothetical protein